MQLRQFLTIREKQIFELLVKNYDTESIAKKLNISSKTVRNHISNVIQKLVAHFHSFLNYIFISCILINSMIAWLRPLTPSF